MYAHCTRAGDRMGNKRVVRGSWDGKGT
jgi:hypothetical protein